MSGVRDDVVAVFACPNQVSFDTSLDNRHEHFRADADWLRSLAPDVLRRVVQSGGDWADLFFDHTMQHAATLRQRAVGGQIGPLRITAHRRVLSGLGLRRVAGGRVWYAASDDVSPAGLKRLSSSLGPWEGKPSQAVRQERRTATAADDTLVRLAADAAFSLSRCVQEVRVELRETVRRTMVVVSDGTAVSEIRGRREMRVEVEVKTDAGITRAYALDGFSGESPGMLSFVPERVAGEAVQRALTRSEARPIPSQPMPVVVTGGWGGVWLHEAVGHLLEADLRDPIRLNVGMEAASEGITIVDDPTLADGRGSYGHDDEATPAGATLLVEDGTVVNLMTDKMQAGRLGLASTGNGRRQDFRFPPLPRMSNLVLQPGVADPGDLVAEVTDGLFVEMIGRGRVFPGEDRYEFDVLEGHRIESGRLTHPAADVRIGGPLRGALGGIRGAGADLAFDHARGTCVKSGQAAPVSVGMPTVLLERLEVFPAEAEP